MTVKNGKIIFRIFIQNILKDLKDVYDFCCKIGNKISQFIKIF